MPTKKNKFRCILISKKKETDDVITLKFELNKKSKPSFIPGQYVIVYIKGQLGPEGKAYTISNTPSDKFLAVTVKKIGRFSTMLHELKVGSAVTIEGPMGYFYPDKNSKELVFLAAGIGITPFLSIIRTYAKNNLLKDKKIYLFYSNKTQKDVAFFEELNKFSEDNKNIKIFYYLTRQKIEDKYVKEFNRIDIKSIKDKLDHLDHKDYFICGPIRFVMDIRKMLLDKNMSELNIHTESFY